VRGESESLNVPKYVGERLGWTEVSKPELTANPSSPVNSNNVG
jgi:hypothetical protein